MSKSCMQLTLCLVAFLCAEAFVVPPVSTSTCAKTATSPTVFISRGNAFHVSSATSDEVVEASAAEDSSGAEESSQKEAEKERNTLFIGNLPFGEISASEASPIMSILCNNILVYA